MCIGESEMNKRMNGEWLRIRLEYLCWKIQFWMRTHRPLYPVWLRGWLLSHFDRERHFITWQAVDRYRRNNREFRLTKKNIPLPWWVGVGAQGPIIKLWNRLEHQFATRTGGRSHRCEFTDKEMGALHGYDYGPFMDQYFEEFIRRISL